MVVHHGERGWTAPTEMHQLFDLAKLPSAAPFTPSFSFPVDDLAKVDTVMLARRTMTMFARLALWFLRGARQDDLMLRELPHWHELFRRVAQGRDGTDRAVRALSYYATVNETEYERSKESFLALVGPALEPAMMTIAEQLQAKGRTEGKAEGEAKGKAEGEAKGLRDALSSVLQARGLAPTASEDARIQSSIDLDELHTWVTRAVTVTAVAELFTDRPHNS